jgi:hypothetical protein
MNDNADFTVDNHRKQRVMCRLKLLVKDNSKKTAQRVETLTIYKTFVLRCCSKCQLRRVQNLTNRTNNSDEKPTNKCRTAAGKADMVRTVNLLLGSYRETEFEVLRHFIFRVQSISEVDAAHAAIGMDLKQNRKRATLMKFNGI